MRAYSVLNIKAASDEGGKRRFAGVASTPTTDRMGDIVEPKGAQFKLPIPLLWQHDSRDPIGWITSARVTDKGIEVEGEVADIPEEGELKTRLATAWQMLKAKLVRGLSIGFNSIESARIEGTYGFRFLKWEWLELSAVTIPANQEATITAIKSIDLQQLAASGRESLQGARSGPVPPGVKGTQAAPRGNSQPGTGKGSNMKPLNEQINDLRTARTEKAARMTELVESAKNAGRDMSDDEVTEYEALRMEVRHLDGDIRSKEVEALNAGAARPVDGGGTKSASASRGPTVFARKADPDDKFKGQSFVRGIIARAASVIAMRKGNFVSPIDIAAHRWGKTNPNLVAWIKAGVSSAGTGSGDWGAELADSDTRFRGDFVEFLYSMTVFDRLPLREVPARVHIKGQDGAATGFWVGEKKPIPVTSADASDVELTPLKVAALAVASMELIADSDPSAELWIRDCLAQASAQRVDTTFLSNAAAVNGVSPAGILNGLTPVVPSGADADAVRADLMSLYAPFLAAKNASGLVQIMTPSLAKALQLLRNSLGQREFPDIRADGGTLEGDAVYTGDNVTPGDWILLKPSDIWKIGDSGLEVDMTDQATIEQDTAPTGEGDGPTAASANLVSLWQTNQVGFKVVRRIAFQKRRASAVAVLSNAEYGGVVS